MSKEGAVTEYKFKHSYVNLGLTDFLYVADAFLRKLDMLTPEQIRFGQYGWSVRLKNIEFEVSKGSEHLRMMISEVGSSSRGYESTMQLSHCELPIEKTPSEIARLEERIKDIASLRARAFLKEAGLLE